MTTGAAALADERWWQRVRLISWLRRRGSA